MAISRLDMSDAGRGEWGSHYEYFLTSLGLAVGLGNIWRSPVGITASALELQTKVREVFTITEKAPIPLGAFS